MAIKVLVTMQELGQVVPPLTAEVFAWLADHGAKPSGQPFWKYNVIDMDRDLKIEAGVAVEQPVPGDDRVLAGTLPGGSYATLVHIGHPDQLIDATAALPSTWPAPAARPSPPSTRSARLGHSVVWVAVASVSDARAAQNVE